MTMNWRGKLLVTAAGIAVAAWPIGLGLLNAGLGLAQTSGTESPQAFDVASVKVDLSFSDSSSTSFGPGGSFTARGATLRGVIQEAYQVKDARLVGGPDWAGNERYDIVAKPDKPVTDEQARSMLQALLADRFRLKVHRETRQLPVYELTVGNNGPKLKEASDSNCDAPPSEAPSGAPPRSGYCGGSLVSYGRLTSRKVPVQRLAGTLSEIMDRPVLDMTGLKVVFDIDLQWAPDETQFGGRRATGDNSDAPSIYAALQELGLKLDARRGPVDVLVIEQADRPSAN